MIHHIHKYDSPFFSPEWDDEDNKYLVYDDLFVTQKLQHNLPIWIQILDHSNIMLHQLSKKMGGEMVFRKTDMVTCMGGIDIGEDRRVGGYKHESNPQIKNGYGTVKTEGLNLEHAVAPNFTEHEFTDSSEWRELSCIGMNEGILVKGRAGTGKYFVIKQIIKLREKLN